MEEERGFGGKPNELQQALADPNVMVSIAIGPPCPELIPQDPNSGLHFAGRIEQRPKRFIFKKAHMSRDDFRIFDSETQRLVAVSHHHGKNPYSSLDPFDIGNKPHTMIGEMESMCNVSGYGGMPSFKIRPKTMSLHGRQVLTDRSGREVMSVAKISRIKSMSMRHNLAVYRGDNDDEAYLLECDMMGRTISFKTPDGQMAAFVAKSTKNLITTQLIGKGSEMIIDVAPGVDWTMVLASMMLVQQVGAHYIKDLFENFFIEPCIELVTESVVEATGTEQIFNQAEHMTNQAVGMAHQGNRLQADFNRMNRY